MQQTTNIPKTDNPSKEREVTLACRVPFRLKKAARIRATQEDTSVQSVVVAALEAHLRPEVEAA